MGTPSQKIWAALGLGVALVAAPALADQKAGVRVPNGTATGQTLYWNGTSYTANGFVFFDSAHVGINTTSPQATLHVVTPAIGTPTVEIQAISGQTADLLDVYNSTASTKFISVNSTGNLNFTGGLTVLGAMSIGSVTSLKGLSLNARTISTTTTLNATDNVVFVTGPVTITLPSATGSYRQFTVKNTSTGTIPIVVAGGTQTIDGTTSFSMSVQNQSRTFQSDGVNYQIVGGYL